MKSFSRLYLVLASLSGFWFDQFNGHVPPQFEPGLGESLVVGIGLGSWAYAAVDSKPRSSSHSIMRKLASRTVQGVIRGHVEYTFTQCFRLLQPLLCDSTEMPHRILEAISHATGYLVDDFHDGVATPIMYTIKDVADMWKPMFVSSGVGLANLAPSLAYRVARAFPPHPCVHCVGVSLRINRKRLLNRADVSAKRLRSAIRAQPAPDPNPVPESLEIVQKRSVWELIDWLDMVREVKSLKRLEIALPKFAKVFCKRGPETEEEMMARLEPYCRNTLREGRIRLDHVAMNIHREFITSSLKTCAHLVDVYVYIDGSTQWGRNLELLACSYDIVINNECTSRMCPLVTICKQMLDSVGKQIGFIWLMWLSAGPDFLVTQLFLSRIRGVCTDVGVEKYSPNA